MQLVIDIPKYIIDMCKECERVIDADTEKVGKAIKNGTSVDNETVNVLNKIKAEIREWYWQADKQALAKDPCVVDAMIDLFIRTINKYKIESEQKSMTREDLICIAEDFSKWLEDMAEKYSLSKNDVQDLIKQFLI